MTGPGARGSRKPPFAGRPPLDRPAAASPLKYTRPEGWKELDPRAESIPMAAAFQVGEGDQTAKVTVLRTGGSLLANVNRWRGQLGLNLLDEAQLSKDVRSIQVGNTAAPYVDLTGIAAGK